MNEMNGKIVLITGAAGSIGKPMCVEFAKLGATVVMAGRGKKIIDAVDEVKKLSGSSNVELLEMDLSSLKSVRSAAENFKQRFQKLDVLMNNAAVFSKNRKTTAEGYEQTFGVNHLGHFLFTNLLTDKLKSTAGSRVIVMTMPTKCPINFEDLQLEKKYSGMLGLQSSKAANTCFAVELSKRLENSGVMVNALSPELTRSTLPSEAPAPIRFLFKTLGASPEKSKNYGVNLACKKEHENITGKFFKKSKIIPIPNQYSNADVTKKLWDLSEKLVGI
jgi:NAD(P)-dependent dehydrogenase (short-subunit alcohol dehydrogenase family)